MAQLYLDAKGDFAAWQAFAADGHTASTAVSATVETTLLRYGPDGKSVRLQGDPTGGGHLLRWSLPATDLGDYDEVRLYVRGDRVANGATGTPFYLELHLGSAALPTTAAGNTWRRYLPIFQSNSWELVRYSLADLPAQVRSGLDTVELRFVEASAPFDIVVDDLSAVHEEMISDVEAALIDRLNDRLVLSGKNIPALLDGASLPDTYLFVTCYNIQTQDLRQNAVRARRDFIPQGGYSLAPAIQHWILTYRIDAVAPDRTTESRMMDFVLRTFSSSDQLVVDSYPTQITFLPVGAVDRGQAAPADPKAPHVALFYQVLTRQELGAPEPVKSASQVLITTDSKGNT
ncbi:MAG TPA: hypothetical protein VGM88_09280 [Kofleriaceae bacterium]|jgi:hypothetical protein